MKRAIKIILSWILVFAIPLSTVGIFTNIIFRMPDLYQYQMNADRQLSNFGASGQEEELAGFIAKYMQHREAEFQYQTDTEDEMSLLFTRGEQNVINNLRTKLDIIGIISLVSLLIVTIAYIVLLRGEHFVVIRERFKNAILVTLLIIIFSIACLLVAPLSEKVWELLFAGLSEGDFLFSLFTFDFLKMFIIANAVGSILALLIAGYTTWKYTKPKTIFW